MYLPERQCPDHLAHLKHKLTEKQGIGCYEAMTADGTLVPWAPDPVCFQEDSHNCKAFKLHSIVCLMFVDSFYMFVHSIACLMFVDSFYMFVHSLACLISVDLFYMFVHLHV